MKQRQQLIHNRKKCV